MMKRKSGILAGIFLSAMAYGQGFSEAEYFFDVDPGIGNATSITLSSSNDTVTFTASVPTASLPQGFHFLGLRVLHNDGVWSMTEIRNFYISPPPAADVGDIIGAEYFFDTDPGAGNGNPLSVGPSGATVNFIVAIPTALLPGFHYLVIRTMDVAGNWGWADSRVFYIPTPSADAGIVSGEYFFDDADPGLGSATAFSVGTGGDSINLITSIPVSLPDGYHNLTIRLQDGDGKWGFADERKPFFVGECMVVSSDSMTAWWPFDSTATSITSDIEQSHDGVLTNGAVVSPDTQVLETVLVLDGIDDFVGVPDNDDWAFGSDDFTIELLANFTSPGGDNSNHPGDKFIGQSEGFGSAKKWTLSLGGNSLFLTVGDGSTFQHYVQTPFIPSVNRWYHLALTRSGNTLRTFIDGELAGTQVVSNLVLPNVSSPLTIGYVDWVQGGELGYMHGSLDEVIVYRRALTAQEMGEAGTFAILRRCRALEITTPVLSDVLFGSLFSQALARHGGTAPFTWSVAAGVLPAGVALDSNGVISGTPTEAGEFSFTAQVTDLNNDSAEKVFVLRVLLTLPEPQLSIFKSGTNAVPGREMDYFIAVENQSSIVADSIITTEFLEPWFRYVSSTSQGSIESRSLDVFNIDPTDSLPITIKWSYDLGPAQSVVLSYEVRLNSILPLNDTVNGGPTCAELSAVENSCIGGRDVVAMSGRSACSEQFPWEARFGAGLDGYLGCLRRVYKRSLAFYNSCMKGFLAAYPPGDIPPAWSCWNETRITHGAVDPNEKLVLAARFIQDDQLLVYPIHFENIGTIEAQDVFIWDTLDANLDLSTLEIITPAGSSFDSTTRVLRWDLLNINLQPDSSAYALYSIRPKPGTPSGTIIHNRAYIQFEVFDTFATNQTVNIIDMLGPEGIMDPLPDTMYQTAFPISWSGTDSIGEIKSYSVFVSVDSGAYVPFILNTEDTTAIYTGEHGKSYGFTCIAEDLAGNIEVQDPIAETTTRLVVLCANKYYRDVDSDGFGDSSSTTLSCNQPVGYVSDSTDCSDASPSIHPGAVEVCNFLDDNCDGQIDEGVKPIVSAGPDLSVCINDSVQLNVTGADIYAWTPSAGLNCDTCSSTMAQPSLTTTYTVYGINLEGCWSADTVTVTVNPLPVVTAGPDTAVLVGQQVQLTASGAVSYSWSPATGLSNPNIANPIATVTSNTCYTVTGTDLNGCQSADAVCIDTLVNGVNTPQGIVSWIAYPNPANSSLTVKGQTAGSNATIEMRNLMGSVLISRRVAGGKFNEQFDLTGLPASCYVLSVSGDGFIGYKPLIIAR